MNHTNVLDVVAGAMARDARVLAALFALSIFVIILVSGAWVARVGLPRLVGVAVRVDERAANASCRDSNSTTARSGASIDARDRDDYRIWRLTKSFFLRQASAANRGGVRVSIESFGLTRVRGVQVCFTKPGAPVTRVKIAEVAYVGKLSTLMEWLLNFVLRKASGKSLRNSLPRGERGARGGIFGNGRLASSAFVEMTPRSVDSPSSTSPSGSPSGRRRFLRLGVGSLRATFVVSGVEITKARASARVNGGTTVASGANGERANGKADKAKTGITRGKWRLMKGLASFVDVTVTSITVREEAAEKSEMLFCDKVTFEASGTTGSSLKALLTMRFLRGKGGWSVTDANVHLVAEFDAEKRAIAPAHAGFSGATLSIVKRDVGVDRREDAKETQKHTGVADAEARALKAVEGLLKAPRKCKVEFKRIVMEKRDDIAPMTCSIKDFQASVERCRPSGGNQRIFRKKEASLKSPFASTAFATNAWSEMALSVRDVHVVHGKDVRLFEMTGATASVRLALAKTMPENGGKLPATAAFGASSCEFTHHRDSATLVRALKSQLAQTKNGASNAKKPPNSGGKSSTPWDLTEATLTCDETISARALDDARETIARVVAERVQCRYGVSIERGDAESESTEKRCLCVISDVRVVVPNHDPILYVPSVELVRSDSDGDSVDVIGTTVDVDMRTANSIATALEEAVRGVKATMAAAKDRSSADDGDEKKTPTHPSPSVTARDSSLRARCVMTPLSLSGDVPDNPRGTDPAECALELRVARATVSKPSAELTIVSAEDTSVSMHDTVRNVDADRRAAVGRVDYENSANESTRIALFGRVSCELTKSDDVRAHVSIEDVQFDAEPDVAFFALEMAALAKRPPRTDPAVSDSGEAPTKTRASPKMDVTVDARNVCGSIFIAPGACAKVSVGAMDAHPLRGTCELRDAAFGMNGHTITELGRVSVTPGEDGRTTPHVAAIVRETAEEVLARRKFVVGVDDAKLTLPAGLDLGDAFISVIVGEQVFRDILNEKTGKQAKKERISMGRDEPDTSTASTSSTPVTEIQLNVDGIDINVEDSNRLERLLRARQTVLSPAMAAVRFDSVIDDTLTAVTKLYLSQREFLASGGGPAVHISVEGVRSVAAWGGGKGNGDELVARAANLVRRVDAPYSDSVALQLVNIVSMRTTTTSMRVELGDATKRPFFKFDEWIISGNFVQGRQYAPRVLTNQVQMACGRRHWAMTNGPLTPPRPTAMWYTDARMNFVEAEMFVSPCLEPYLYNMSRELTTRFVLPRLPKSLPGGGGGRPEVKEYDAADPQPPSMPWWDMLRSQWRGVMDITMLRSRMKMDGRGRIEHIGAHGGEVFKSELEIAAEMWQFHMKPRRVEVRCADFTVSRIQDDEMCSLESNVARNLETPKHKIVILPVMEVLADYEFKSLRDGGDGHRTHYRHDSQTGEELFPRDLTRSTGCAVNLGVTFSSKEDFVKKQYEEDGEMGDFFEHVRGMNDTDDGAASAEYSTPTFALTPDDVEFVKIWKDGMANPMKALRGIWNLRPWGKPRRVRHPDSISLPELFESVDTVLESKNIHVVNASSDGTDDAYGACFALNAVKFVAKKVRNQRVEFTLHTASSQFHVPERDSLLVRTFSSPGRFHRTSSVSNRVNVAELDDVIKEMLGQNSATSPVDVTGEYSSSASRPESTEPTVVFDAKRMEITQRREKSVADEGIQIEVDAPRILYEAENRNSILGWIKGLWVASQSQRREPTWSELDRIVKSAEKLSNFDEKTLRDKVLGSTPTFKALDREEFVAERDSPKRAPDTKVLFVIQITTPQINFKGNDGAGRMLLAAEGGLVVGRRIDDGVSQNRRLVTVSLQQVQAYVAPTNVDLNAGVQWLKERTSSGSETFLVREDVFSDDARKQTGSLLRRIFKPGAMVFEHSSVVTATTDAVTDEQLYAYDELTAADARIDQPKSKSVTSEALSEFSVRSPEIEAEMNSSQYAVLMDVMESLFLTPPNLKRSRPSFQASKILMNIDRTLISSLSLASAALIAKPMKKVIVSRWRAENLESSYRRSTGLDLSARKKIIRDIDNHWAIAQKAELYLLTAIEKAEDFIRLYRRRAAMRMRLEIEYAAWTMFSGGHAFMTAKLSRLSLSRERQANSAGIMRFKLHGLGLVSRENNQMGRVFSRWMPNGEVISYDGAPLIDFFSIRAGSPPEKPVYDHMEMSVQPFEVHIVRSQYKKINNYLFPPSNESSLEHEIFARSYAGGNSSRKLKSLDRVGMMSSRSRNLSSSDVTISSVRSPTNQHGRKWHWGNDADYDAFDLDPDSSSSELDITSPPKKVGSDVKKVLLRVFHIHPLHMKVTYEGQKRSFRDIQLGVDAFSIDQFSGPWRDLSSVLKNHIVWSVLKSLVGFRGKFVQSEIDQNSAVERAIERLRKSEQESAEERRDAEERRNADRVQDASNARLMLSRSGYNVALDDDVAEITSTRNVDSKKKPLFKTRKRRRFRPYKNAKKFLARLGVGAPYTPAAPATADANTGVVLRTLSSGSNRDDDDDDVFM